MSNDEEERITSARPPCRKCMIIRLFLMAVAAIAVMRLLSPATLRLAADLSTLELALLFVGALGIAATCKAVAEHIASRADPDR